MTALLEFKSVSASVGERTLLEGIEFEVSRGEVVGLVGRNGVGKTTLMRLASAIQLPSSGLVRVEGVDIDTFTRRALARRIALVPQDLHVPFPFPLATEMPHRQEHHASGRWLPAKIQRSWSTQLHVPSARY